MKYILYCRKSQESEDRQVQSLDAQERELREYAARNNIEISEVLHESRSAKTIGRPVFAEVMNRIQSGKADGLLVWKLDRLARNLVDDGLIIDLLQQSVIKSIQTPSKEYLPSEPVYLMLFELGVANQFSRDLSENVKRGNREKLKNGGYPCHAPFGYLNNKADKTLVLDPVRSKYVKMMFDLYSTGRYSFKELAVELYEQGLRTNAGKKVHPGTVRHILQNPIYHGVIRYGGNYYTSACPTITTKDKFDTCQDVMTGGAKPRKQKHVFPLTGLFTCGVCGCAITAEVQKGYTYYHCTNGKGICDQKKLFLRQEKLEEQFVEIFDDITFDEELIELMYQAAKEKIEHEDTFNTEAIANLEKEVATIKERESRLLDAFLAGNIDQTIYDEKQKEIKLAKLSLEQNLQQMKQNHQDPYVTLERTKNLFLASNRAKSKYMKASPERKREIAYEVLSNAKLVDRNMLETKVKSPYDLLANTPSDASFSMMCG